MSHLTENNMTYFEHFRFAAGHGFAAIAHGLGLLVHAVFPEMLPKTGSSLLSRLEADFSPLKMPLPPFKYIQNGLETRNAGLSGASTGKSAHQGDKKP